MGCVYQATNTVNGKSYVGMTVKKLHERRRAHEYSATHGSKLPFHCALRRYGLQAFHWEIVFFGKGNEIAALYAAEKKFIKLLDTKLPNGYNLTDGGEGCNGFKHTKETKAKMGVLATGRKPSAEQCAKIRQAMLGRTFSDKTIEKMRVAAKGKKKSPIHKAHIRASLLGRHPTPEALANLRSAMQSDSVRSKMRASAKARPKPPPRSKESREKQSKALMGHPTSAETRAKIGKANRGRKWTEEQRANLRAVRANQRAARTGGQLCQSRA